MRGLVFVPSKTHEWANTCALCKTGGEMRSRYRGEMEDERMA